MNCAGGIVAPFLLFYGAVFCGRGDGVKPNRGLKRKEDLSDE